jgi:modification methylase
VLKDSGTLWVIGTYHNIYRIGAILQDLGYWILNDIVWIKTNPMPNFRGVRFTNAHETLLWACKQAGAKYTFNHHAMKALNDDLQMRSDWLIPICSGPERVKVGGKKGHSTQKPEALLYRLLLASSNPGDVVLDPFFGSGTTGAVAKKLGRHWIGIDKDPEYVRMAHERMDAIPAQALDPALLDVRSVKQRLPRLPFGMLLEAGLLYPGQILYFRGDRAQAARLKPDGRLMIDGFEGSIHQAGSHLMHGSPCNGWTSWFYENEMGELKAVDELRDALQREKSLLSEPA